MFDIPPPMIEKFLTTHPGLRVFAKACQPRHDLLRRKAEQHLALGKGARRRNRVEARTE
ncbi:MAG TPA: hypothetical protein VGC31_10710 [Paenirhodobacter sp.]